MRTFKVFNKISGADLGCFRAETAEAAYEAFLTDAGADVPDAYAFRHEGGSTWSFPNGIVVEGEPHGLCHTPQDHGTLDGRTWAHETVQSMRDDKEATADPLTADEIMALAKDLELGGWSESLMNATTESERENLGIPSDDEGRSLWLREYDKAAQASALATLREIADEA